MSIGSDDLFSRGCRKILGFLRVLVEATRGLEALGSCKCEPLVNPVLLLPSLEEGRFSWAQLGDRRKNPSSSSAAAALSLLFSECTTQSWLFFSKVGNCIDDSMKDSGTLSDLSVEIGMKAELDLLPKLC